MQYPVEIPGVTVTNFLRTAKTAIDGEAPSLRHWVKDVRESMANLRMDSAFAERNVNEGFSGGEKKRNEILQLELLKPKFAVLDETDSGLDVDALKIVSEGVNRAKANTGLGILLITHYTRILRYIKPDFVHVFVDGQDRRGGRPRARRPPRRRGLRPLPGRRGGRGRVGAGRLAFMVTALAPERFDEVEEALKDVIDPELGVNIVDLGLIYDLGWDDENDALVIHMTLTERRLPAHRRARGADRRGARRRRRARSASTGCGCRRGVPSASPTTAAT